MVAAAAAAALWWMRKTGGKVSPVTGTVRKAQTRQGYTARTFDTGSIAKLFQSSPTTVYDYNTGKAGSDVLAALERDEQARTEYGYAVPESELATAIYGRDAIR